MSYKTWEDEYYPISAYEAARGSALEATRHCIRKWEGLWPDVRREHGGVWGGGWWIDWISGDYQDRFEVDGSTCALCVKYWSENNTGKTCAKCPLAIARDDTPCYLTMPGEFMSPYEAMLKNGDPGPMLAWLHKAQAKCE